MPVIVESFQLLILMKAKCKDRMNDDVRAISLKTKYLENLSMLTVTKLIIIVPTNRKNKLIALNRENKSNVLNVIFSKKISQRL